MRMKFFQTEQGFSFLSPGISSGNLSPYIRIWKGEQLISCGDVVTAGAQRPAETFFGPGIRREYTVSGQDGIILRWYVTELDRMNALLMGGTLENGSSDPVYFNAAGLVSSGDVLHCQGKPEEWHLSSMMGDFYGTDLKEICPSANEQEMAMWRSFRMEPPHELPQDEKHTDERWRGFDEYLTLYRDKGNTGLFISPAGDPEAFLSYDCYVDSGTIRLELKCDMSNVLVKPGQSRDIQQMIFAAEPLKEIVPRVMQNIAVTHGCRTSKKTPCGWCSWYDLNRNITESTVMETVDALIQYKERIPMDFIQIDDGYQVYPGDWRANEKFPRGLAPIIEKIQKAGAMPGIWTAPLYAHESTELFKNHPDWFARDDKGDFACKLGNWGGTCYGMDPSHPGVKEYLRNLYRQKYEEGFRYFKIDFNTVYANGRTSYDPTKTSLQLFRETCGLYRETLGEESYLLSSWSRGNMGYFDGNRTGTDTCDNWDRIVCCIRNALWQNPIKSYINGLIFDCDPDVTYLKTGGLTEEERRTWHSFVGLFGGIQQISDPMKERREQLRQFEILIPPAPEKGHPVYPGVDRSNSRYGLTARRSYGDFGVYMVWNPQDTAAPISTELDELDQVGKEFHVFSFWDETYLGVQGSNFQLDALPPHGCRLLRFTPCRGDGRPVLVGSDLHISMGAAEIKDVLVRGKRMEILLNTAGAMDGHLYVYSEEPFARCTAQGCQGVSMERRGEITQITLMGRSRKEIQSVLLE